MNSKNSKTYDTHRLNLIQRGLIKTLLYQILASTIHGKI